MSGFRIRLSQLTALAVVVLALHDNTRSQPPTAPAGGPEETRREYPFILKSANSSKKVPITTFKISR